MQKDYYKILGIEKSATAEEIHKAYRNMARKYHPDVNKSASAESIMQQVNEAYDVLSDVKQKAEYDRKNAVNYNDNIFVDETEDKVFNWFQRITGTSGKRSWASLICTIIAYFLLRYIVVPLIPNSLGLSYQIKFALSFAMLVTLFFGYLGIQFTVKSLRPNSYTKTGKYMMLLTGIGLILAVIFINYTIFNAYSNSKKAVIEDNDTRVERIMNEFEKLEFYADLSEITPSETVYRVSGNRLVEWYDMLEGMDTSTNNKMSIIDVQNWIRLNYSGEYDYNVYKYKDLYVLIFDTWVGLTKEFSTDGSCYFLRGSNEYWIKKAADEGKMELFYVWKNPNLYENMPIYADFSAIPSIGYELKIYNNSLVYKSGFTSSTDYYYYAKETIEKKDYDIYKYGDVYLLLEVRERTASNTYVSNAYLAKDPTVGKECYHINELQGIDSAVNQGYFIKQ